VENETAKREEEKSATGGCSLGCASLFVLAAFVWPALHVIGRTYEPEILFVSFVIGGPAFLIGNILAILGWRSKSASAQRLAKWALRIMWGFVALFFLLAIVAFTMEKFGKSR
jgi:hypothetical protein